MGKEINYSFIIPHKNTPQLLQRCLDSIPQREDIEIIVVDNNSSPEIVDFNHFPGSDRKDVRLFHDNESIGGGGARNTGLKHARGKWVLFADADDYYSDGFIDVLDKYIDEDLDLVYFNFNRVKDGMVATLPRSLRFLKRAYDERSVDTIKFRYTVPWNKMINRSYLQRYSVRFEDCLVGNDVLFTFWVGYYANNIVIDHNCLYKYCVNNNSVSTKKWNTVDYYKCWFRHHYQCAEFYKYIGYSKWRKSLFVRFLSILRKSGFSYFILSVKVFFSFYNSFIVSKCYFVDTIVNHGLSKHTNG